MIYGGVWYVALPFNRAFTMDNQHCQIIMPITVDLEKIIHGIGEFRQQWRPRRTTAYRTYGARGHHAKA